MQLQLRHLKRRRWIALWAVAALLVNQVVFAAHLCGSDLGTLADNHHRTDVTAQSLAHAEAPKDDNACRVHCSHPADGNQQSNAPGVTPLAHIQQPVWNAAIDIRVAVANIHSNPTHRHKLERWRLQEFCTLLI